MLATILLILQIVGAAGSAIKAFTFLWELIQKIRSPKVRRAKFRELRTRALSHVDQDAKTINQVAFDNELANLQADVVAILAAQKADLETSLTAALSSPSDTVA